MAETLMPALAAHHRGHIDRYRPYRYNLMAD
jgi:hypothetical protein